MENPTDNDTWRAICGALTPNVEVRRIRSGEVFLDLGGEGHNRFYSFTETLNVLVWSLYDPGHPEVVGCSEGISRAVALLLWFAYNAIVVIVLLNLLIALMNVATNAVVEDRVVSWKYHRQGYWLIGQNYPDHQQLFGFFSFQHATLDGLLQQGRRPPSALQHPGDSGGPPDARLVQVASAAARYERAN